MHKNKEKEQQQQERQHRYVDISPTNGHLAVH